MRIYIEGAPLFNNRSGVGQYTKRLLDAAIAKDPDDRFTVFGFLLYGRQPKQRQPLIPQPNLDYRFIRYLPGRVYNKLYKARIAPPVDLLLGRSWDVGIYPNFVSWPTLFGSKKIVIIYDLSYIHHPQYSNAANSRLLRRFVPRSIRSAAHIITISENAKKEIIEFYKLDGSQITIISPAVDHDDFYPRPSDEVANVRSKYGITKPYLLFTGTLEPRKNILGILDAYAGLPAALQQHYSLVLAGGKGWLDQDIRRRLDELKALDIITTGYVPDADLPALYSGASLFVYPSFYEGFGMPPLEAMACGVPVITSNNSSLPEVVGDAGIMIDAADTPALQAGIEQILGDKRLATAMAKKGLARAQQFSWDHSADRLITVIKSVGE